MQVCAPLFTHLVRPVYVFGDIFAKRSRSNAPASFDVSIMWTETSQAHHLAVAAVFKPEHTPIARVHGVKERLRQISIHDYKPGCVSKMRC